ncbi:MAG: hypothetical protein DRH90_25610 [Deltaproteobacteria bacterium]|nr:MAG: hypothetical protein DRH90_25610 [Deltaproteobacteria bacterium]
MASLEGIRVEMVKFTFLITANYVLETPHPAIWLRINNTRLKYNTHIDLYLQETPAKRLRTSLFYQ